MRNVSVEDIIDAAKTTRMTLYRHFESKDDLVLAYLAGRAAEERRVVDALTDQVVTEGREALMLLADAIGLETSAPSFRGCPFLNAAGEYREAHHPVRRLVRDHRAWYRSNVERMVRSAGLPDPSATADQVMMLRDGAMVSGFFGDTTRQIEALQEGMRALLSEDSAAAA